MARQPSKSHETAKRSVTHGAFGFQLPIWNETLTPCTVMIGFFFSRSSSTQWKLTRLARRRLDPQDSQALRFLAWPCHVISCEKVSKLTGAIATMGGGEGGLMCCDENWAQGLQGPENGQVFGDLDVRWTVWVQCSSSVPSKATVKLKLPKQIRMWSV